MKKIKTKINYKDARGVIMDLLEKKKNKRNYLYYPKQRQG